MPQHIVVTAWSPVWTERFAQEAAAIRRILGANCAAVHHIGSTAVPGLCAKPIIDILPVVYDLSLTDAAQAAFERIGYEYLGEFGIPGRRYLRKGGDERPVRPPQYRAAPRGAGLSAHPSRGGPAIRRAQNRPCRALPIRYRGLLRRKSCVYAAA